MNTPTTKLTQTSQATSYASLHDPLQMTPLPVKESLGILEVFSPSPDEKHPLYKELFTLYNSFDHSVYPYVALQLKSALFLAYNAVCEQREEENIKAIVEEVWKGVENAIKHAKIHLSLPPRPIPFP